MDNPRPEKVAVVDEVRERLSSSTATLLTEYRGLKVGELAELRRSLRQAGGDYKIYKNTLVRFAVQDLGLEGIEELLVGPTALTFVEGDAAAVAKALRDYGRTNPNLVLKGGLLGDKSLSAEQARALAELPSREVLLSQIAGALAAPMVQFAGLLQALPRNLAYGLKALIDERGGVPDSDAPAADEAPAATDEAAPAATDDAAPATDDAAPATDDAAADDTDIPSDAPAAEDTTEAGTEPTDETAEEA
jgi:large subunit ribosomal protein L10